ncbi:MAG: glycosyltransferase [Saprospiraceae bacterium]|nr:glycosyltransferase [Saprospiraceae bacterium]
MARSRAIIVFLRVPESGKVKTRLASTMGKDKALSIYKQLTTMTLDVVRQTDAGILLFYFPDVPAAVPAFGQAFRQQGTNLGEKISNAFDQALTSHQQVLIIGTDCPYLTVDQIDRAFNALDTADVVVGPASDGGYYLLGLNAPAPAMFRDIDWSTDKVLTQTLAKSQLLGFNHHLLEELSDIDYEEDWIRFLETRGDDQ